MSDPFLPLTDEVVDNLSKMLDPKNAQSNMAMKRPASQVVGYSLAETATPGLTVSHGGGGGNEGDEESTVAGGPKASVAATPGGIYVPPSIADKTAGLPVPSVTRAGQALQQVTQRPKPKGNDIWASEELETGGSGGSAASSTALSGASSASSATAASSATSAPAFTSGTRDPRVAPEYDLLFKERINSEDVYLGMDFTRDGSSAMCEGMVVRFKLPKTQKVSDIELEVEKRAVILRTKDYAGRVELPHKVIEQRAAAKWDGEKKVLSVTVTIAHDPSEVKLM